MSVVFTEISVNTVLHNFSLLAKTVKEGRSTRISNLY